MTSIEKVATPATFGAVWAVLAVGHNLATEGKRRTRALQAPFGYGWSPSLGSGPMTNYSGFTCACCGAHHPDLPMNYTAEAPAVWDPAFADAEDCLLSTDQCVIRAQHYFVKGLIEIPVIGSDDVFSWGVWVSLSRESFARASDVWDRPGRETGEPYFGWLTTDLPVYPAATLNLKTRVHTRPVGERPFVELEPTDHPLAVEQRTGISLERVREIASTVLHSGDDEQR